MSGNQVKSEGDCEVELRLRALARLTGRTDAADPRANPAAALGVLYDLASSPATAGNALALLHELQVHQVEVEMQGEELRRSRTDLEVRLARYVQIHDLAPFAYFTIDTGTAIHEVNLAGARLFGANREALLGCRLETMLAPESGGLLRAMLADARRGSATQTQTVHLAGSGITRSLHIRAAADALDGRFLVAMIDAPAPAGPAS